MQAIERSKYELLYEKRGKIETTEDINNLLYVKSTLYAEKLFDMYINERKPKNRDKYFYEIQDLFDGKITVEDILNRREITFAKAQDLTLLKRHMFQ